MHDNSRHLRAVVGATIKQRQKPTTENMVTESLQSAVEAKVAARNGDNGTIASNNCEGSEGVGNRG